MDNHYQYNPEWIEAYMKFKNCKEEYEMFARIQDRLTDSERQRKQIVFEGMQRYREKMDRIKNGY